MEKQVKDFIEGEHVTSRLMISNILNGVTNAGAPYLTLTLQDSSKSIESKIWDVKPEITKQLEAGKVYEFNLEIIKYKNNLQAKVLKVLPVPQSEINPEDFAFKSPIEIGVLKSQIQEVLNSIQNPVILKLVNAFLNRYQNEFYQYPAASKIHHNFIGGLATHTCGMLKVAKAICDIYGEVNRDYLYAGIILHDLGKITELSSPLLTEYTIEGKLIGHISIMDGLMNEVSKELSIEDSEEVLILRHMVLSHHGQYEYGSPVLPMTLEAEILTYIDNIDSKINVISKNFEGIEEGEFTPKIFALENRMFYKHK